ncbi:MAG TPA: GNAT family N-acetyltransferase [Alphaproteobacteria bacterium]|nr:GNAT family N-acetyltransferase [Alphaproteobacteria bacterium]
MDIAAVLDLYDRQLRRDVRLTEPGVVVERTERATRVVGTGREPHDNCLLWFAPPPPAEADARIAAEIAAFAGRGRGFEWKHHSHDRPADLAERLVAHGLEPQEPETLVVLDLATAVPPRMPAGLRIERVEDPARIEADIEAVRLAVYPDETPWLGAAVAREVAAAPEAVQVMVAYDGDRPVSIGRINFHPGTDFASLWSGATLAAYRGRGLYQTLVARRAEEARRRGYRFLTVDASENSRPILERLGFRAVCTTTPHLFRPG